MNVKIENNSVNLCDSCEKDCETCDAYDKDYLPGDCDTNICCCSKYAPLMTREQLNDVPDNNVGELISRKALISKFEQWQKQDGYDNGEWNLLVDVITEIKNMPLATDINVATKDGADCISRQAAIDAVEHITTSMSICVNSDECHGMKRMQRQAVIELANMPAIQPKRGHWIEADVCGDTTSWECSCCHNWTGLPTGWNVKAKLWFCPKCTADMREVNNENY